MGLQHIRVYNKRTDFFNLEVRGNLKLQFMDILVCPICKASLTLDIIEKNDDEVINGTLSCKSCKETYPIEETIPNLLPSNLRKSES